MGGSREQEMTCSRCSNCERMRHAPVYLKNPMMMWDKFPCPPPGSDTTRLVLELDWTGALGRKDGCEALKRVARRCGVDLTNLNVLSYVVPDCDYFLPASSPCGTNCVIIAVLAFICLIFVIVLICVVRYVKKNGKEKEVLPPSSDHTRLNTQVNRYYVHNHYWDQTNTIPGHQTLAMEARLGDAGIEARLLKIIRNPDLYSQACPCNELCNQSSSNSRHSTTSSNRSRQAYDRIYWREREKEFLQQPVQLVPSNDSLHRKQLNRGRSTTGSASDMSHEYEYISDHHPFEVPYSSTDRRSNNSFRSYIHDNTINFPTRYRHRESANFRDRRFNSMDFNDEDRENDELVHYKYKRRGDNSPEVQNPAQGNAVQIKGNRKSGSLKYIDDRDQEDLVIKGYSYTPSPRVQPQQENGVDSGSEFLGDPDTLNDRENAQRPPSVNFDLGESPSCSSLGKKRKKKRRRPSSASYNSNCSDSTSLSESSYRVNMPRTNGSLYRSNYGT